MSDVVVIGAGVIGVSVAFNLARRGLSVQILDSGRAGMGTTDTTFAIDITARKTPHSYFELAKHSATLHEQLDKEFSQPSWRFPAPSVEWGTNEYDRDVMLRRRERLLEWGYESTVVDIAELAELAPGLRLPPAGEATAVVYPQACWYDTRAYIDSLLAQAKREGVTLTEGVQITDLHYRGNTLAGVRSGERVWTGDLVINCAGAGAGQLTTLTGAELPLKLLPGVIGYLDPVPGLDINSIWTLWTINFRPTRNGGLCLHSYPLDAQLPEGTDATTPVPDALTEELRTLAASVLPHHASTAALKTKVGVRPVPADGLPIIGATPNEPRLYHVVTHSGIHLAPALAESVAEDIVSSGGSDLLSSYRADRATNGHTEALDDSMREMTRSYRSVSAES
ncbi:NAD(P)/FAD-dependent oxidoreductase [Parasphingorhabdus pacifica]